MTNDRAATNQQQLELFDLGKIDEPQVPEAHPVDAKPPEVVFVRPELTSEPQASVVGEPLPEAPPSWEDLLERTGRLLASKRPESAHPHAQDLVRLRPSDLEAQLMAATAAVLAKEHAIADAHLASARLLLTRRTPEIFREQWRAPSELVATRRELSRAQDKRGRRERRIAELRTAKKREPDRAAPLEPAEAPAMAPDLELATDPALPSLEPGHGVNALGDYVLRRAALAVMSLKSYETLLAFAHVEGVDRYEYQVRTVTRVLRDFHGRVLLADEVGLGKTIEACLCLKEYMLRGIVSSVLILVPPGLRSQWRDELANKFHIEASIVEGDRAAASPDAWGGAGVKIASLGLARLEPHASNLTRARFDLVIIDEAHRLKNRRTRSWKVVDQLRARFLLLLSATPIENELVEIYNVLTLLRPGHFSTESEFRRTFVGGAGPRTVKDPGLLRKLLREVMIRNTRALAEAKLPPRFATTLRAAPSESEARFYADLGSAVRAGIAAGTLSPLAAGEVLRRAGSSPGAALATIERVAGPALAAQARALPSPSKDEVLKDLLRRRADEKVLLFAAHLETLDHLVEVVREAGRRPVLFHGGMAPAAKEAAIAAFAADHDVLVASESGGEGFNLQFARTLVNYDVPWNPMRIEQRIGRVHRIGQTRDVFVFNLVTEGTIEEEIVRVLDENINMFELVVGEIDAILGRLGDDEKEFQDLVLEIYAGAPDAAEARRRFDLLANRMIEAKGAYETVKRLEHEAFGRDLEV